MITGAEGIDEIDDDVAIITYLDLSIITSNWNLK